jgi:hypothetical protein
MTEPAAELAPLPPFPEPTGEPAAAEANVAAASKPLTGFEQQVQAAQAGIKAGHSPSQVKAALLARGCDPLTAETAYRTARRRLFESNRRLGARLASYAIFALCGGTLVFVPLGWTIPLVVVLLSGLLLMGVATLVWLTGLGADEN